MKLLIICSKKFYNKIENIKSELEKRNIRIYLPNCYDNPSVEDEMRTLGKDQYQKFKAAMFK